MKTSKSSLRKVLKYIWSFIQPWEYFISSDIGNNKKEYIFYFKRHKRSGKLIVYKEDVLDIT